MTGSENTTTRSPHGTKNMEIDFSAKDICNIIKACKDTGVTELCLGSLQLKLDASSAQPSQIARAIEALPFPPQLEQTDHKQLSLLDDSAVKEMIQAQQAIDDPTGFETDICDGFIEKERVEYNEAART